MIDLHCHILPGIDDGSKSLEQSLEMARIAVDDGIHTLACTPHIYPGMYMNDGPGIERARDALQAQLDEHGIALKLVVGADVHLVPGLVEGLRSGRVPTLNRSRYFLLEPSHTTPPPRLEASVLQLISAGYTPIVTHPERLSWVESHYPVFQRLIAQGAWMQVTAGALTGVFGSRARYWGERFIGEGHTHLLATDAHSTGRRLPRLTPALAVVRRLVGEAEAQRLVVERPQAVLNNLAPQDHAIAPRQVGGLASVKRWWSELRPT
ncbi:tyrosine-protein phosphatase [Hydrogenophaga sp. BPS33]|uniref:tyrosine-protein phosphatase n=1 Tax=Hydrogenophaga sp. BPS33 TaxID=2651974 RepID=UPI00131FC98E|nr:CpsB/CapC family capsule biosynthesis tyrosine phosphatase [Hydrogenophaga sp. BPS33]QHE88552.1 capsular biosynthesis protein [Hydrogenophaga sp. BPS33]